MVVLTTTLTFGASLHTLVSRPALYGWNWDYAVQSSDGYGPVPNKALAGLRHDPAVQSYSGIYFVTMQLDGVEVPTLLANPGSAVAPPIISGHGLATSRQIVLGAATLAQLHKRIGDTVDLQYVPGFPRRPIRLTVAGVATMPAIGIAEGLHTSMGTGALVPADAGPVTESLGPQGYSPSCDGPNMVLLARARGPGRAGGSGGRAPPGGRGEPDPDPAGIRIRSAGETSPRRSRCSAPPRSSTTAPWARPRSCSPAGSPLAARVRPRARPGGVGAAVPPGSRAAPGARVHPTPTRGDGGVARIDLGRHRGGRGHPPRSRPGTLAVDPVRGADRRGAPAHRSGLVGAVRRGGRVGAGERRRGAAGSPRRARTATALVLHDE